MVPNENMLSVKEVAARLAVGPDTVRRLIRRGFIAALKLPTQTGTRRRSYVVYRIAESEVKRFINRWTVTPLLRRA
jgi:excisionase family DNA binding protein